MESIYNYFFGKPKMKNLNLIKRVIALSIIIVFFTFPSQALAPWAGLWGKVRHANGTFTSPSDNITVKTMYNGDEIVTTVDDWNGQGSYRFENSWTWTGGTFNIVARDPAWHVGSVNVYFPGGATMTQAPDIYLSAVSAY